MTMMMKLNQEIITSAFDSLRALYFSVTQTLVNNYAGRLIDINSDFIMVY